MKGNDLATCRLARAHDLAVVADGLPTGRGATRQRGDIDASRSRPYGVPVEGQRETALRTVVAGDLTRGIHVDAALSGDCRAREGLQHDRGRCSQIRPAHGLIDQETGMEHAPTPCAGFTSKTNSILARDSYRRTHACNRGFLGWACPD
jgi:hypothetical protein